MIVTIAGGGWIVNDGADLCQHWRANVGFGSHSRISAMALMFAVTVAPKTFNNCLGLERGLWQHQTRYFADVPKRRVFGASTTQIWGSKLRSMVTNIRKAIKFHMLPT